MDGTKTNESLAMYTTLRVGGPADIFYSVTTRERLIEIAHIHEGETVTVLGGGSNVLIPDEGIRGVVIQMNILGVTYEDVGDHVRAVVGAGVEWDRCVHESSAYGLSGAENLSGIPGSVGASPVQNIGAYGVEARDVIEWVEVCDMDTKRFLQFRIDDCAFGYRDSVFKKPEGKRYIVTRVAFLFSKTFVPHTTYKDFSAFFGKQAPQSAQEVRDVVLLIRSQKLPDVKAVGTAGSFFKNPYISKELFDSLKKIYPQLPGFPTENGLVKIPLAWVLDHALNLKGVRVGNVSLYEHHALVLCTHDGATAKEVDVFANVIAQKVFDATGITVEREVQTLL